VSLTRVAPPLRAGIILGVLKRLHNTGCPWEEETFLASHGQSCSSPQVLAPSGACTGYSSPTGSRVPASSAAPPAAHPPAPPAGVCNFFLGHFGELHSLLIDVYDFIMPIWMMFDDEDCQSYSGCEGRRNKVGGGCIGASICKIRKGELISHILKVFRLFTHTCRPSAMTYRRLY
jgi:hypothetical protein